MQAYIETNKKPESVSFSRAGRSRVTGATQSAAHANILAQDYSAMGHQNPRDRADRHV